MKEIAKYLRPYWKGILVATVMVTVSSVCNLLLPTLMSDVLNNGIYAQDMNYIFDCCLKMLLVALVGLGTVLTGAKISNEVVFFLCRCTGCGVPESEPDDI